MKTQIPQKLINWLNENSPEIRRVGAENIEVHVVDKLPFWFTSSKYVGQVWKGKVYLKKEWYEKYTMDKNILSLQGGILRLFFHELGHVVSQHKKDFWIWLLFYYLFQHKKEEKKADDFRDKLWLLYEQKR